MKLLAIAQVLFVLGEEQIIYVILDMIGHRYQAIAYTIWKVILVKREKM